MTQEKLEFIRALGFTPLEIVLMLVVACLFGILFKVMSKNSAKMITALHDSSTAVSNNTTALKELKEEMRRK